MRRSLVVGAGGTVAAWGGRAGYHPPVPAAEPDLFAAYLTRWGLVPDGAPIVTRAARLLPVRRGDEPAMLKVATDPDERHGHILLRWWAGDGAARLLAADDTALLLGRATGSRSLAELARSGHDDEATIALCDAIAALHRPRPTPIPAGLVDLPTWFSALGPGARRHGGLLREALATASRLLADLRDVRPLHGDLHHDNVLDFGARGWLAIDPKHLLGDPAFDYAVVFANPDMAGGPPWPSTSGCSTAGSSSSPSARASPARACSTGSSPGPACRPRGSSPTATRPRSTCESPSSLRARDESAHDRIAELAARAAMNRRTFDLRVAELAAQWLERARPKRRARWGRGLCASAASSASPDPPRAASTTPRPPPRGGARPGAAAAKRAMNQAIACRSRRASPIRPRSIRATRSPSSTTPSSRPTLRASGPCWPSWAHRWPRSATACTCGSADAAAWGRRGLGFITSSRRSATCRWRSRPSSATRAAASTRTRAQLEELSRRTDPVALAIGEAGLDRTQLERQRRLLDASRRFIAEVLSANGVTGAALVAFLRAQMDDIRANIADAARDQLHTTHATFSAWVADMTPEQWSQLRVVVGAGHMDRTGNLASQYFSRALGDRWEGRFEREDHDDPGRRVMTSEDVTDEESAFALLATHVFDTRTSNAFFGEESRMGRDVLADAAERELIAMFGEQPAPPPCDVTPGPARSRSASGCPRS
nr:aminoglycoside phosphotransferase family protein [Nannocystis pusilla]